MPVLVGVAVLLLLVSVVSSVATEVMWYRQLGFGRVYATELLTRTTLFLVAGLVMAAAVVASMLVAYRQRPIYAPVPGPAANLDRYREGLEPLRRVLTVVLPLLLGLFAGSAASSRWETVLLWWNRTSFGEVDPIFGHDIGFYVFTVPFLRLVAGLLTAVVLLAGLAAAATHYLYGGLRLSGPGTRTTPAARIQLAATAALLVALQAGSYWLDRYATLTNVHEKFDGASFTDVNVVVPARGILAIAAIICALLFLVTVVRGGWRFPAAGVALLVVTAVVAGGIVPALVQRVRVAPNEASVEAPYIQNNIDGTRAAFGIDGTDVSAYAPTTEGSAGALGGDAATTASIRILDPAVVSPTFAQNQQVRGFYQFGDPLDVDRYTIDGQSQDVVVAVRELREAGIGNTSWVNTRTAYTHGYGIVAAAGNDKRTNGEPTYLEQGIPTSGSLPEYQPRIYFGEKSPEYSIVGAPAGDDPQEIDYPSGNSEARNTFDGDGGPSVGNLLQRALYAIKFRDANILLSSAVNPESQILYDRTPRERVQKVAPYLTLDGDPYPTIVGGPREVGGRRLHHLRGVPLLPASGAAGGDGRHPDDTDRHRGGAAAQPCQLHPQLREGHRRRLRRLGGALRVGRRRPGAAGLDEGLPQDREAAGGHERRADVSREVPGRPVQGAADGAGELPRHHAGLLLLHERLLARARRPDGLHRRRQPRRGGPSLRTT